MSTVTTLVIPNSVTEIGMNALGPNANLQDIYFCGTSSHWSSIDMGINSNYIAGKTIHFVADVESMKILNEKGENIEGTTIEMNISELHTYSIQLTYSNQGEALLDSRYVEWFCVVPNTPTNDINAIESAKDAGDIVELSLSTEKGDDASYSVSLNAKALKSGNAKIIGYVKKNPTSLMANNEDHIYSFIDIKVAGQINPPESRKCSTTI